MAEDETPQQRANFRAFLRTNRIFVAFILAIGIAATILFPSAYRLAGFAIIVPLAAGALLTGMISARAIGFLSLATAGLTAWVATQAGPDWPMRGEELDTLAISIGAVAVGLIFMNKRTGETDSRVENAVGALVLAGILAVAWVAFAHPSLFANPMLAVGCEGLAAFADVAGERWKKILAAAAIIPIGIGVQSHLPKEQQAAIASAFRFAAARTDLLTAITTALAGILGYILSREQKAGRTASVLIALICAAALWAFLVFAGGANR